MSVPVWNQLPGKKDLSKMIEFVKEVKKADETAG